mmetsp:Transcript_14750/g.29882  ORF Transcript_14750/g.29882 Transcript_14750/m.29882 type:complete len:211 (-) Transcript_14750:822-1454(-)
MVAGKSSSRYKRWHSSNEPQCFSYSPSLATANDDASGFLGLEARNPYEAAYLPGLLSCRNRCTKRRRCSTLRIPRDLRVSFWDMTSWETICFSDGAWSAMLSSIRISWSRRRSRGLALCLIDTASLDCLHSILVSVDSGAPMSSLLLLGRVRATDGSSSTASAIAKISGFSSHWSSREGCPSSSPSPSSLPQSGTLSNGRKASLSANRPA